MAQIACTLCGRVGHHLAKDCPWQSAKTACDPNVLYNASNRLHVHPCGQPLDYGGSAARALP